MVKIIFADVLFLINFIINYLLLFSSSRISCLPFSRLRLILSASLGALYSVLFLLPEFSFLTALPAKLVLSLLMVLIAFGNCRFTRAYLTFICSSLLFGGAALLASFVFPDTFTQISGGVYYIHLSFPALFISAAFSFLILHIIFLRRGGKTEKMLCSVCIKNLGKETKLPALLDTGNSLSDPASGGRVVISDLDSLRAILPEKAAEILSDQKGTHFPLALDRLSDFPGFKLVPYKTVGIPFSLLLAYRPEEITLDGRILENALCAISEAPVSDGSGYVALI